ncbi:uncharacterized protein LOC142550559 [Primulina tabacum]|uniref:uncharacterized protein LOC142550559 n=1 Tax=Primulina tabacum TaxID=48773 RepID=UPI003F5A451C
MSQQDHAKALIFLRHHLNDGLKVEYLTVKEPRELWKNLKEIFDHQRTVILPRARYEWMHLRLQDFKSVSDYNSALFKTSSTLIPCGEKVTDQDMLEKTFSTFHASNVLLQQQYRERRFQRYSELISCLLVAEQNNDLLMKNYQMRPIGSTPFPEANGTTFPEEYEIAFPEANANSTQNHNNGRGRGRGRGQRRYTISNKMERNIKQATSSGIPIMKKQRRRVRKYMKKCYRCGMEGHWSRTCRTAKHLVDLYQKSIKEMEKWR